MTGAHAIRAALDDALEAQALGHREASRLYNPDRDVNSLAERLMALRAAGVPEQLVRDLFADVRAIIDLNAAQTRRDTSLSGRLDELATSLQRAQTTGLGEALGVQALARKLRPALHVIQHPATRTAAQFVRAIRDIDRIIATTARSTLLGASVRHELGKGKHALLTELAGDTA